MNKKFLLAAMALPMLFTACSQDEYLDDIKGPGMATPSVEGFEVTLAPNLGVDSRAIWDNAAAKLTWEANKDLISMYWVGTPVSPSSASTSTGLTGLYNSVFKTADGESFSSESMVFVGGNVAVYPADTKFVEQGPITLSVPHVQDENIILKAPYISNYLNVSKQNIGKNVPGYNNGFNSPVKLAANVLYLYLDLANTAELTKNHDFAIESVNVVATTNRFAKTAKLFASTENVNDEGIYINEDEDSVATITQSLYAKGVADSIAISSTNIEKTAEGKYEVKFVVLPTQDAVLANLDEEAKIVINTNCGRLEVKTQQVTKNQAGTTVYKSIETIPVVDEDDEAPVLVGTVTNPFNADTVYTIAQVLEAIVTSHVADEDANSNFAGERIGMIFDRTIKADMANATLTDSRVYSSDDIKKYIAIHKAMNSKEVMNLILSSKTNSQFNGLTSEALALVDGRNVYDNPATPADEAKILVKLEADVDSVWVSTPGVVYTPKAAAWKGNAAKWILAAGNWTMNDTYAPSAAVEKIINEGTLTIAGTTTQGGDQNKLAATLKNEGIINIAGNNTLYLNGAFELGGASTINVAATQTLHFAEDMAAGHDFQGKVVVSENAFLTVENGKTVHSKATIDNSGTIASTGNAGGLCNDGTINVKGANARTYVQDNTNGVINMYQRSDIIKVEGGQGQIVYTYTTADGANFTKTATDKFTSVVFGSDIKTLNLIYDKADLKAIENVDFTFGGTTTLNASNSDSTKIAKIGNMIVKKGAHVYVDPDNELTVENLENNGTITIGGTINYTGLYTSAKDAKVLTVGSGSIVSKTTEVSLQNAVTDALKKAALTDAGTATNPVVVKLEKDFVMTDALTFDGTKSRSAQPIYVTLDLNGATIKNTTDIWNKTDKIWSLISVKGNYVVTIKGNGKVLAKENDCYAIDVRDGGKVIIEDGEFVGNVTSVYAHSGSVEIKGGKFSIKQQQTQNAGGPYSETLNCLDENYDNKTASIKVIGGSFYKFNPIVENSDVENTQSYVPTGYTTVQSGDWYEVKKAN